jgi:hypothetical protein
LRDAAAAELRQQRDDDAMRIFEIGGEVALQAAQETLCVDCRFLLAAAFGLAARRLLRLRMPPLNDFDAVKVRRAREERVCKEKQQKDTHPFG